MRYWGRWYSVWSAVPQDQTIRKYPHFEEKEGARSLDFLRNSNTDPKMALFGCHDSTLAAILASLGALEDENNTWPSFTSSLAVELFNESKQAVSSQREHSPQPLAKKPQKYIRILYNGRPITIPGCRPLGRHLEGDESFCNLVSQKMPISFWKNDGLILFRISD